MFGIRSNYDIFSAIYGRLTEFYYGLFDTICSDSSVLDSLDLVRRIVESNSDLSDTTFFKRQSNF